MPATTPDGSDWKRHPHGAMRWSAISTDRNSERVESVRGLSDAVIRSKLQATSQAGY